MEKGAIFPLFYHPPIEFFMRLIQHKASILFENHEHFPKQTFRNRTTVHSPNGKLDLIVPVIKGANVHTPVKDVRISYEFNWQRQHIMSLQTSYRSSAYFEYYENDLIPFYEKNWKFLYDYNLEILQFLFKALKLNIPYSFTPEYLPTYPDLADYRETIHPKKDSSLEFKKYFQVFEEKNGFLPNLSILDLLFNQGPQSIKYLI
ncbi:WbqC family protein [Flavihumibacter sp. R14]|nr:WbqC family protein [Flavihumibacter soli]